MERRENDDRVGGASREETMTTAAATAGDDPMERLRQRKLEEALEIKSLRRIISAYLNYSDAAEKDVRKYERSFRKLRTEHKALLSHFPIKCQRLRRCISVNTAFVMSMLQAFEPPLDMSQEIDIDVDGNTMVCTQDCQHLETASRCEERNFNCGHHVCVSGKESSSETKPARCREASDVDKISSKRINTHEELHMEISQESANGGRSGTSDYHKVTHTTVDDDVGIISGQAQHSCCSDANGNMGCSSCDWLDPSFQLNVPLVDVDKVRCIIRNIVRDWAPEGKKERDQCYKPILEELDRLFPVRSKERPPTCLVPGAGLGRLALEISCHGFVCQGNEFSYYMMICSSFILNHTQTAGEWTIYPWIHSNCNSFSDNDQLRAVSFPDIHPASVGITEGFSMCGGDFVEVYNDVTQEASWDVVVTCFFLDTAHNIVEYIEIISKILKDGGVWINLGPLLYHFADTYGAEDEMSIELSLEDVKEVAFHYGFEMDREKLIETTYTANPRSMMQNRYFAAFWTMKKKPRV